MFIFTKEMNRYSGNDYALVHVFLLTESSLMRICASIFKVKISKACTCIRKYYFYLA